MTVHHGSHTSRARRPSQVMAFLLSLFAPGAGHLYAGRLRKGLTLWLVGTAVFWLPLVAGLTSTFTGLMVLLAGCFLYVAGVTVSAVLDARRARAAQPWRDHWVAVVALAACQAVLGGVLLSPWAPVRAYNVPSGAMEPTIRVGERIMADLWAWHRRDPERGELVIFRSPAEPDRVLLKRVMALPGERIEIRDKRVSIDGDSIEDPWATHTDSRTYPVSRFTPRGLATRDQFGPFVVPEGTLFLLGDNRDESSDSRTYGPVDRSLLIGRPLYVYWSPDRSRIGRSLSPR